MNKNSSKWNLNSTSVNKKQSKNAIYFTIVTSYIGIVFSNILNAQTTPQPSKIPQTNSSLSAPPAPPPAPSRKLPPQSNDKTSQADSIPHGKELVSIDFPNGANLSDIIKTIGVWTGKNFVLAQGVAGSSRISIISPEPLTKEEAYQAFLSALNISGFTTVETGAVVKILPIANAKSSNIKTYYGANWAPSTDEIITQVVPLRNIDANSVINQLRPLLGVTQYSAFSAPNSLILTDTGNRIRRILEVIKLLDAKANQPVVTMEQVYNMDAKDAVSKINEIFGSKNGASLSVQKVLAEERTNSVILVGPKNGLDDVVHFVRRLDKPSQDQNSQTMVRIRPLDYADAEKLAQTLQALTQNNKSQSSAFRPSFYPPGAIMPNGSNTSSNNQAVADLNGVKVTADKATNALVIQGSKSAYDELDSIIAQLDKRRAQVYIESQIIDLNINNGFEWAPSAFGGSSVGNGRYVSPFGFNAKPAGSLFFNQTGQTPDPTSLISSAGQSALLGIMSTSAINVGPFSLTPGALIFALKTDANTNILQTPSMMVSDNEAATFSSNQEYSVITQVANPNGSGTVAQPQKYTVTTSLKVTPQISRADFVSMKINLQTDDAGAVNAQGFPNPISKRTAESVVIVQNGQTAVIGGLTQDTNKISETKVPLLGDIPILGWLFKTSSNTKIKTSLTLFVTPYIVRNSEDLEKIYEQKIKDRDDFLKMFYGDKYKKEEFYSKLPSLEAGKAPPAKVDEEKKENNTSNIINQESTIKKNFLPSEDPHPIHAPSNSQGSGGFGLPQSSAPPSTSSTAPPPPFGN